MKPTDDRPAAGDGRFAHRLLSLGSVRPRGWLASQLAAQAENITGRLDEIWPDVGETSAWLGGTGEDFERGPYFADGLIALAHLTGDERLHEKSHRWVEAILSSQLPSGQFGPSTNHDWWPRMVALKVLMSHHSATGDPRVPEFLARYFHYQVAELPRRPLDSWAAARGADNMLAVWWLYDITPAPWLLDLIDILDRQTTNWGAYLTGELITGKARLFDHRTHGPNVAMGIKADCVRYLRSGDRALLTRSAEGLRVLDRWHGQVHGFFSGDEWLAGREAHQGVETCQVVEGMSSLETMYQISDDPDYGDLLELLAFNLLPASSDPAMRAHQYHQQANQVSVGVAQRHWSYSGDDANVFGLEPHFGCCTANLHQGWPKFVAAMWQESDGVLTAVSLAPCEVDWDGPNGTVRIAVLGDYPFDDKVRLEITCGAPTQVTVRIRIPHWSSRLGIGVDGVPQAAGSEDQPEGRYWSITREWEARTTVVDIDLHATATLVRRERQAVGVRWGSLVMALSPGETWVPVPDAPGLGEWWIYPRRSWNLGLVTEGRLGISSWTVHHRPVGKYPFAIDQVPTWISVRAAIVPEWRSDGADASPPPDSPVLAFSALEHVELVPYGSARIRTAEFPTLRSQRGDLV